MTQRSRPSSARSNAATFLYVSSSSASAAPTPSSVLAHPSDGSEESVGSFLCHAFLSAGKEPLSRLASGRQRWAFTDAEMGADAQSLKASDGSEASVGSLLTDAEMGAEAGVA